MRGDGRVTEMEWNPYRPRTNARSCEVLILEKKLLEYLIEEAYAGVTGTVLTEPLFKQSARTPSFFPAIPPT